MLEPAVDEPDADAPAPDTPDAPAVAAPPTRFVTPVKTMTNPAHRHPLAKKTEKPTGESRWMGRPREGFTQSMEAQAGEMGASKVGRSIKGLPTADDRQGRRA